jgi:hypothetical protein
MIGAHKGGNSAASNERILALPSLAAHVVVNKGLIFKYEFFVNLAPKSLICKVSDV